MAVPSTGELSLKKIANEKNDNDYNSTDTEMVQNGNISLRGLSSNSHNDSGGGNINLNADSTSKPNQSAPHEMSEFYGYDHDYVASFHTTTLSVGTDGGYGFAESGFRYQSAGTDLGSLGDATLTYNGRATTITILSGQYTSSTASSGTVQLKISDDLASSSPPNSGWTSIKFYWDQTNNSGSPDETLTRSSATYTASGGVGSAYATWEWSVSGGTPYNTWFGSTSGGVSITHFVEMI